MKEELTRLLCEILPHAECHITGKDGTIDLAEYKSGYDDARSQPYLRHDDTLPSQFLLAGVDAGRAPAHHFEALVELVAKATASYANPQTGKVKFSFPDGPFYFQAPTSPDPTKFAEQIIRCAALHGVEETAQLVQDTLDREPLKYTRVVPLAGVVLEEERINVESGVYLVRPESVKDSLDAGVPEELLITLPGLLSQVNRSSWGKPTLLCIQCETAPIIEEPGEEPRDITHRDKDNSSVIYDPVKFPVHLFTDALSLIVGHDVVEMGYRWDCFDAKYISLTGYQLVMLGRAWRNSTVGMYLKQEQRPNLLALFRTMKDAGQLSEGLRIALSRWRESRRVQLEYGNRPNVDAAIDLRVALETLSLDRDDQGEYGFRLAVRGPGIWPKYSTGMRSLTFSGRRMVMAHRPYTAGSLSRKGETTLR